MKAPWISVIAAKSLAASEMLARLHSTDGLIAVLRSLPALGRLDTDREEPEGSVSHIEQIPDDFVLRLPLLELPIYAH